MIGQCFFLIPCKRSLHLHLLARYIPSIDYPTLLSRCLAMCRPGGIVCWSEAELPMTASASFERLAALLCEALEGSGQRFMAKGTHEEKTSEFSRRYIGITPVIGGWLRQANCGFPHPHGPRAFGDTTRVTHLAVYAVEFSAGLPLHSIFTRQATRFADRIRPLLLQAGVIGEADYASLRRQLEAESHDEDFCGLAFLLRVWGMRT
jgi:hypothetical protein